MEEDPTFFDKILWSDESTCQRDGFLNMHNVHSWQVKGHNPHLMREDHSQYQFKINLWSGILNGEIIGHFELPQTLNGPRYLQFLQNELPILLENVPLNIRATMWLQNDGCPAHFAVQVRQYQNETFPSKWIGRAGPIEWPPRSPDLNPLDFFYWGCIKEMVYSKSINSVQELRHNIQPAARAISQKRYARMLKRNFIKRCRACIRVEGKLCIAMCIAIYIYVLRQCIYIFVSLSVSIFLDVTVPTKYDYFNVFEKLYVTLYKSRVYNMQSIKSH